jgi:hypothetical protein
MGVASKTLVGTEYAIHGTNNPGSIGGFVSHGCIRMYNEDITDLFKRVSQGTEVVVTPESRPLKSEAPDCPGRIRRPAASPRGP